MALVVKGASPASDLGSIAKSVGSEEAKGACPFG